ncbi:hypothetical protein [Spirosoma fluminis]
MKYSFEFYRNIILNAMVIALAVAAISNHFISLIELGVLLLGLLIQLGLAAYKPNVARQFEQHSIVGRLVVVGSASLLVLATSPQRSLPDFCRMLTICAICSLLLNLYSRHLSRKRKRML